MEQMIGVEVEGAVLAAGYSACRSLHAPALVFLHAGVSDARLWQAQVDAYAPAHAVLRHDRRGFGQSLTVAATPHSAVADLCAVMDAVGLARAVLVGGSQGGRVAIDAALQRPERVAALVLVAPAVGGAPAGVPTGRAAVLEQAMEAAEAAGDLERLNELEAQFWLDGPEAPPGRVAGAARALFLDMNGIALRAPDPGPSLDGDSAWSRLETLRLPTQVIWGDLDVAHLQARCERLLQRIPSAQRVVLPGSAHLPALDAPRAFNDALGGFLAGL